MGLSTHVLDTAHGCPAGGMAVELYSTEGANTSLIRRVTLDADGRNGGGPLLEGAAFRKGTYRLVFDVEGYFRRRGVQLPDPSFLGRVSIDFGVSDPAQHYHVPLLVSPYGYSTYRGS